MVQNAVDKFNGQCQKTRSNLISHKCSFLSNTVFYYNECWMKLIFSLYRCIYWLCIVNLRLAWMFLPHTKIWRTWSTKNPMKKQVGKSRCQYIICFHLNFIWNFQVCVRLFVGVFIFIEYDRDLVQVFFLFVSFWCSW